MTPKVCIDAGHGGHDSGAVGPRGLREKDVTLNVALMMGAALAGKCHVIYTRQTDVFLTLTERAQIANRGKADVFISIHCNAGPKGLGTGFEVWTSKGQTASDWLATDLFVVYAEDFPGLAKRMDMSDGDVDKESPFTVLVKTNMAAALFELEFIHTEAGEAWLEDPKNRARAAGALARGVEKYLKLGTKAVTPPEPVVIDPPRVQGLGDLKLLEIEALAKIDRLRERADAVWLDAKTELEALFRKP